MEKMKKYWDELDIAQKFTVLAILSTVFHYGFTIFLSLTAVFLILVTKSWKKIVYQEKTFIWFSLIIASNILISAWNRNGLGMLFSVFMWMVILITFYLRTFLTKSRIFALFEMLVKLSLITVGYIIIAYVINRFFLHVLPYDLSRLLFFNENYGGVVYSVLVLIAFTLWKHTKNHLYLLYIVVILILIIIAKSRGAFIGTIAGLASYRFWKLNKKTKMLLLMGIFIFLTLYSTLVILKIIPLPKIAVINQFVTYRISIWNTGLRSFLIHPIIGQGQFTHYSYCKLFGTLCIEHSHNLFLELFIVYGIVGMTIISLVIYNDFKKLKSLKEIDINLYYFVFLMITTTLLHGLVDYQLFWVQPGILFFTSFSVLSLKK